MFQTDVCGAAGGRKREREREREKKRERGRERKRATLWLCLARSPHPPRPSPNPPYALLKPSLIPPQTGKVVESGRGQTRHGWREECG
jgi:hypothetical protein